jgi:hypothetical protein
VGKIQLSSSHVYRVCSFQTSDKVPASRNKTVVEEGAAHFSPIVPLQTTMTPSTKTTSIFRRFTTTDPGLCAPVLSLTTAGGWRLLSLVLPKCIILIFETLAETRYRPMSAPSVPQVAGDIQKREGTSNYRSWAPRQTSRVASDLPLLVWSSECRSEDFCFIECWGM